MGLPSAAPVATLVCAHAHPLTHARTLQVAPAGYWDNVGAALHGVDGGGATPRPRRSPISSTEAVGNTQPIPLPVVEHDPRSERRRGITLSWVVTVIAAGVISVMTAPGQTAGLSVFTDPIIDQLGVDRTAISLSYLIGTLAGALAQPLIGRASDRWDVRRVIIVIAVAFAGILFALSFVTEILGLTFGFVGVRMAGQGALGLAVTTAVSRAVTHRRGLALGIFSAIGSAGISLAPLGLERLVSAVGIQDAWRWEALLVLVLVIPAALLLPRPVRSDGATQNAALEGYTLRQSMRTGMFWVLTAAVSTIAMLATALAFHQIALLGERGLSAAEAAANFLPQTVTALLGTLVVGALIDRADPRIFIVLSMIAMGGSLALVSVVESGWSAIGYGLVLGVAGGALRGMEAATFARYYGVAHIGSIRGVSTSIGLAASALGPYALAVGVDLAGGFATPALWLAIIPVTVLIAGVLVRPPRAIADPAPPTTR